MACTKMQAINAADLLAEKIQCALLNSNMPNDEIVLKCAIQPGDVDKVIAIVGQHRTIAAKEAAQAVFRAGYDRSLDDLQKKADCIKPVRDAGK